MLTLLPNKKIGSNSFTGEEYLNLLKSTKTEKFKLTCEEEIVKGFTATNGHFYRTNRDDQINMIGQKDDLDADETITTVHWKTEDVGYLPHTREEWLSIYFQAFQHKKTILTKYNTLKMQVLSAATEEEVNGISW